MSNTESGITIITPRSLDEARSLAALISKSSLLPADLRGKEPEILMTIMTGAELGLAPMQSIRAIDVIKGKPTLKAETMTALVRGRKEVCEYLVLKKSTATECVYETKRVGDPAPTTIGFTIEEAKAAGLIQQTRNGEPNNWMRFPAAMLRARAGSAICKAVYSDLILGVYDPEELSPEQDVTPARSVIDVSPTEPKPDAIEKERGVMLALFETTGTVEELDALWPRLSVFKGTEHLEGMVAAFKSRKTALVAASRATKPNPTPPSPSTQTVDVTHFVKPEASSAPAPDDVPF